MCGLAKLLGGVAAGGGFGVEACLKRMADTIANLGQGATFLFGSELKTLKSYPPFSANIDRNALCLLKHHNYIPAPYSIYQGIAKQEAGCLLAVSLAQPTPVAVRYWSAADVAMARCAAPFAGRPEQGRLKIRPRRC